MLLILFSFGIPKNRKTGQRKENRTQQLIGRDSVRFTFELSLTRALNYNSSISSSFRKISMYLLMEFLFKKYMGPSIQTYMVHSHSFLHLADQLSFVICWAKIGVQNSFKVPEFFLLCWKQNSEISFPPYFPYLGESNGCWLLWMAAQLCTPKWSLLVSL